MIRQKSIGKGITCKGIAKPLKKLFKHLNLLTFLFHHVLEESVETTCNLFPLQQLTQYLHDGALLKSISCMNRGI